MDRPLVSVVIPTFNEPASIVLKSIQSIMVQSYNKWELLIVDDSIDMETKNMVDSFQGVEGIYIYRSSEKLGVSEARNWGIRHAKGDFIAFLDGDDIALPNRLELQLNYLMQHADVSVLGGAMYIIDENDNLVSQRKYPSGGWKLKIWSIFRNPLAQPAVMIRRTIIDSGFYYDSRYRRAEDLDLWLRIMNKSLKIENLPEHIIQYRVSKNFCAKRRDNWNANFRVRVINFSWKFPLFGLLSVIVSFLFLLVPSGIVQSVYDKENSKLK